MKPEFRPLGEIDRREFVKLAGAGGVAAAATGWDDVLAAQAPAAPGPDAAERDLVLLALDAVRSAGASYADVRITRGNIESIATRERQITGVSKTETYGIGIRALVGGSWGFAATRDLTRDAVAAAAKHAAAIAAGNDNINPVKTTLAPVTRVPDGRWITPHEIDPFTIPIEEKAAAALQDQRRSAAREGRAIRHVEPRLDPGQPAARHDRRLADPADVPADRPERQRHRRVRRQRRLSDTQWQPCRRAAPAGNTSSPSGSTRTSCAGPKRRWRSSRPRRCEPGVWDLVLHPSHLWLTIHESIGHPTELDRAMGYEANFAGTSFLSPPEKVLNKFRYGPAFMNIVGNRTEPGGCATCGWDDEGVPAQSWPIVDKGIFVNYQTTREMAAWISSITKVRESHGHVVRTGLGVDSVPANAERQPAAEPARTDRRRRDRRDETRHLHRRRRIVLHRPAALQLSVRRPGRSGKSRTASARACFATSPIRRARPNFWNSLALVGGKSTYKLGAALNDGKGQPQQLNAVSHGCPIALFRNVNVINTA